MPYGKIKVSREGAVAQVALNRPEARNVFDRDLVHELGDAFTQLGQEEALRAIVLRGEGEAFCAGADNKWVRDAAEFSEQDNRKQIQRVIDTLRIIEECPKPVVGRVQGPAMGGGVALVAVCDIAIASEEARFAISAAKLGIVPGIIAPFVLPRVGASQAYRYFLTAEVFGATRAREIGLIHEVVPADQLDDRVRKVVTMILNNGPVAVAETKKLIRAVCSTSRENALRLCVETLARVRTSPEGQEGLRAFLDKRPASWMPK